MAFNMIESAQSLLQHTMGNRAKLIFIISLSYSQTDSEEKKRSIFMKSFLILRVINQMIQQKQKYLFRPSTNPTKFSRNGQRRREKQQQKQLRILERPQQNFFKLVFQRDTYLWVIFHRHIHRIDVKYLANLYENLKEAYGALQQERRLPICSTLEQVQYWLEKYQCKVALDESVLQYFDEVMQNNHCVAVKVVTAKNVEVVRKVRNSKFSYKVRGIEDNFEEITGLVKEDMEKVKIIHESDELEKVRLPNFMRLKAKDKAQLINYRNNIYCLANLHKNRVDIDTSKRRFIQQCEKMYNTSKDIEFMKYYLTYPFNHSEILRFYTEDTFFYRCLNNTLRMARTTQEFFIIGDPFNKMFHAIKNIYREQYPYSRSRSGMKLYRGADLSPTECTYLQSCIGNYIQIHGFVSTTLDIQVAQKFAKERNHNKIIEIIFEDLDETKIPKNIFQNDYGFVSLLEMSRYEQNEILFNALNIFKVIGKRIQGEFEYFTLKYGTIFKILAHKNPETLKKADRLAYYTYKELMGQKQHLGDLGQIFLKSYETQKSVDYYEAKILQARGQITGEVEQLIINKSQALIMNGEPAKALQNMLFLISKRSAIRHTQGGAKFLKDVLQDKGEIMKEIDITMKYSEAGHALDKFDQVQDHLQDANQALKDALSLQDGWSFQIAFGQFQLIMRMAHIKQSMQNYKQMMICLTEAETSIDDILKRVTQNEISFYNQKKIYIEKTLIYQKMAKASQFLECENAINLQQLDQKYLETEKQLLNLVEEKSYDRSLIQIRKIQIKRRRQDFDINKANYIDKIEESLASIKQSSNRDQEIPKTYHMLAELQSQIRTTSSTANAINYLQKEYLAHSERYGENDPKSMKTVIDIADSYRYLKDSQESVNILRQQLKVVPFKNKPKHTIVSKTLYTMGIAYLDLGQFSYAIKCFEKGLHMLEQILTPKQFGKYHHKFKIQLQMGRTLTYLARYNQAQQRLHSYHHFILNLYHQHSDLASCLSYQGTLYLKQNFRQKARNKFEESAAMFKMTSGHKSLTVAKIKCNLSIIYAIQQQSSKALQCLDEARILFNQIYLKDGQQSQIRVHSQSYMISYYYAEIYKMSKKYTDAIQYYKNSKDDLEKYRERKKKQRQAKGASMMYETSFFNPTKRIFSESKIDNHDIICSIKIFECMAHTNDFSFWPQLQKLISFLQREIMFNMFGEQQKQKQNEKSQVNKKKEILTLCKKMETSYERHRKKFQQKQAKRKQIVEFGKKQKEQNEEIDQKSKKQMKEILKID